MKKKLVAFRLSPETIQTLKKLATEYGTSQTSILENLLEMVEQLSQRVEELKKENKKLKKEKEELLQENQKLLKELVAQKTPWWKKLLRNSG